VLVAPRTLLEELLQSSDYTLDEWVERFESLAAVLDEDATMSTRQLQRWAAGKVKDARPASKRVAARLWGHSFASLIALRPSTGLAAGPRRPGPPLAVANEQHIPISMPVDEALSQMREQWHLLVLADNALGPRYALDGVHRQLGALDGMLPGLRGVERDEALCLAAWFGESASWLHEDAGDLVLARHWNARALEWALEADDATMVAWTLYRQSQQSELVGDVARAVGLVRAARRYEDSLASPTRAALRVQEAHGQARDGDALAAGKLLDEAHGWAAEDRSGEARNGHGSFCTAEWIELERARCHLTLGYPSEAVALYEEALPRLGSVYVKNRGTALSGLAAAYASHDEPGQAAVTADGALDIALSCGSNRIVNQLRRVGDSVRPHRDQDDVARLLMRLDQITAA
jgi:tetratricopeptide (TPR) repeat protein